MEGNSGKVEKLDEEISDKFVYYYFTTGIIIGICKWVIIIAHIFCFSKNGASLLPVIEQSGITFRTSLANILNTVIPLYIFMLGSQNYYLDVLEKKNFNVRRGAFTYMAAPGLIHLLISILLNFIGIPRCISRSPLGINTNTLFSKIKPGFLTLFLFAYSIMLIFSPFVDLSFPSKNAITESKRLNSNSNASSNLGKELLIEESECLEENNSEKAKLININTFSIIKCIITSITMVYILNFLHVSDSFILKFFMFMSIIILAFSVGSFAFEEYLLEIYVLLIWVSISWSFLSLQGTNVFKSEISDLVCSTLLVYLTMYTAGHFFSCIGMEIIESRSYCFLFIPVFTLSYYNFSSYIVTISPLFYPFCQSSVSIQKALLTSWLSIIPIISMFLNICFYINNKTMIWLIINLPDNIILLFLPLAPVLELCMGLYIHTAI
ncbi:putative membrane associated protein [Cryptosporidium canis]|nr:putative membrane associated protein [Cryptosporidium canis]